MKKNVGLSDRAVRLVLSVGVFVLAYIHVLPGNWNIVTWGVAFIFLLTGVFGRCPLYSACGIDTRGQGTSGNTHPKIS
jgi:Inner membrane protein YgaP-like, transmembrane domain